MYCSNCGTRNPDENRFCGMCGARLALPHSPEPERRPPQRENANVTVMPREPQRPVPLAEVLAEKEAAEKRRAEREAERYIGEPARTIAPPPPPPPRRDVSPAHLGGPSFLGLSDPGPAEVRSADYLLDEDDYRPRRSYGRFMLLLLILAVFAGLGYLQWRKSEGAPLLPLEQAGQPPAQSDDTTASASEPVPEAPATPADASAPVATQTPPPVNPETATAQATQEGAAAKPAASASAQEDNGSRADVDEQESSAKPAAQEPEARAEPAEPEKPSAAQTEAVEGEIDSAAGDRELELGRAYLSGQYGDRDAGEAAKWLWKAVSKGNTDASLALADLYVAGEGVEKNCEQARVLLTAAARKGNSDAASKLRTVSCD